MYIHGNTGPRNSQRDQPLFDVPQFDGATGYFEV